jgi:gliding motility-associated transport system ATP-binding protein
MIQASDLTKFFGGKRALGPVGFEIAAGETVGFLGLNGAGKSTLLRILAGDLRPSAGSFAVRGVDGVRQPHELRKLVGFLPESPPLYLEMTTREYLRFAGLLRGMSPSAVDARIPEVERLTHTGEVSNVLLRHLSHGYRQRVGVAQAIIHEPELLILDEPTKGLDPAQIVEIRSMINGLKQRHTVLVSSHILPEIQETCDRLLVLRTGSLIASGTEQELATRLQSRRIAVSVRAADGDGAAVETCVRDIAGVRDTTVKPGRDGALELLIESTEDVRADVCGALVRAGYEVLRLDWADLELENVFLELVGGAAAGVGDASN